MTRTSAALALVSLFASRTVMAEPCTPRAELEGDRAAIERVTAELGRLGVVIAPASARCPSVHAMVALDDGGGIAVAVRGAQETGRSEGRVLSDATLAAAWIDSWARDDLEVASWSGAPEAEVLAPPASHALVTPHEVAPSEVAAQRGVLATGSLSASYELAWTSDSTSWTGFGAAACVRVGRLCVGGRVHAAFQSRVPFNSTAAARSDLSALATASAPIRVGRTIIAPEVGLGLGRFTTRRLEGCELAAPPSCDVMTDPNCPVVDPTGPDPNLPNPTCAGGGPPDGNLYVGDGFDHSTYAPRLAMALRIAVPLFDHVWLDGFAAATYAPLGHGTSFVPAMMPTSDVPVEQLALPGEPDRSYQVGIGLRVGAP